MIGMVGGGIGIPEKNRILQHVQTLRGYSKVGACAAAQSVPPLAPQLTPQTAQAHSNRGFPPPVFIYSKIHISLGL